MTVWRGTVLAVTEDGRADVRVPDLYGADPVRVGAVVPVGVGDAVLLDELGGSGQLVLTHNYRATTGPTRAYVDAQDQGVLEQAGALVDTVGATSRAYTDAGDEAGLTAAKGYTDTSGAATLAAAKAYTDTADVVKGWTAIAPASGWAAYSGGGGYPQGVQYRLTRTTVQLSMFLKPVSGSTAPGLALFTFPSGAGPRWTHWRHVTCRFVDGTYGSGPAQVNADGSGGSVALLGAAPSAGTVDVISLEATLPR